MIGQVKIDDGKEDLEATFGKKDRKNTLSGAKKAKITKFDGNSKYSPSDRKQRAMTESMYLAPSQNLNNKSSLQSYLNKNQSVRLIRE